MKPGNFFPFALAPITLTALVVIALLLVFSISSVIVAWRGSEESAVIPEQSLPPPVAPAGSTPEAVAPEGIPGSQGNPNTGEDFETIWRREEAQRETMRVLKKESQENPDAENIPTEEQIKEMENSGALLL